MITWMTRASFLDTAEDLSEPFLLQTGQESQELLDVLLGIGEQTSDQAVGVRMWVGYEPALAAYISSVSVVLSLRGVRTNLALRAKASIAVLERAEHVPYEPPPWLADTLVLRSHRSNLARRWPKEYGGAWKGVDELWPYIVPVVDSEGGYKLVVSKAEREMLARGERKLPTNVKKELGL